MTSKNWGSYVKLLFFIALFVFEYLIATKCNNRQIMIINYIMLAVNILITLRLVINKNADRFRTFIIKIFKNIAGNIYGIVAIIYFTTHIDWIINTLRESYDDACLLIYVCLYINFLFFPYLMLTLLTLNKKITKPNANSRKVLITSLSIFDRTRNAEGVLTDREKDILEIIKNKKDFHDWDISVNWKPVF